MEKTLQTPIEKRFRHGLIVGKFFPAHQGHLFLIRSAAQFCERVTVSVEGQDSEYLPIAARVQILQKETAIYTNVQVVTNAKKENINAVFSSNKAGEEFAKKLNCVHVEIDPEKRWVPIFSKQIRKVPIQYWNSLLASTQEHLCKRFVIVGTESTGKTTLARALARNFKAPLVPEFGREYTIVKLAIVQGEAKFKNLQIPGMDAVTWNEEDFVQISVAQEQIENDATKMRSPLIICDTDVFATAIWHERYMGIWSKKLEAYVEQMPKRALYILLSDKDFPFVADEIRDGEKIRSWMSQRFVEELQKRNLPFVTISGSREERVQNAIEVIRKELFWKWDSV